jgi:exodeoxyribonuclease-5
MAIELSPDQIDAVAKAQAWFSNWTRQPIFRLFGYAGTGKTTTLKALLAHLGITSSQVACVAPSGRAAQVMSRSLGMRATTVHKRFYKVASTPEEYWKQLLSERKSLQYRISIGDNEDEKAIWTRRISEIDDELNDKNPNVGPGFRFLGQGNVSNDTRLVLVDETSMLLNENLADLEGLGLPIILVGDPGQLPPVQDRDKPKEPHRATMNPDVELTQIHRQAGDSSILDIADLVRAGEELKCGNDDRGVSVRDGSNFGTKFELCLRKARLSEDEFMSFATGDDSQIICGTHYMRHMINDFVRQRLGLTDLLPTGDPAEKIIVMKNFENDDISVWNGSFIRVRPTGHDGTIKVGRHETASIELPSHIFELDGEPVKASAPIWKNPFLDPRCSDPKRKKVESIWAKSTINAEWGWAITCHKAQGSQWKRVCVFNESRKFGEDKDKWLYTAVTRAEDELTVIQV